MNTNRKKELDSTTEAKIKAAAEKVFMEKGFSAARTRDIAEEAGMNLSLLNYYFRSKENLYNIIMMEKLKVFFDIIIDVLNDEKLNLLDKATVLVNKYTDLLLHEPNLPWFLLSEIQQNPDFFSEKLKIKDRIQNAKTIHTLLFEENKKESIHSILSFLGITLFPFIVRQAFENLYDLSPSEYNQLMEERRDLIPKQLSEISSKFIQPKPQND